MGAQRMTNLTDYAEILALAFQLCTSPGFDELHDPDLNTELIEPYHDPVGFPTIGYGHLLSRVKWENLSKYPPITKIEAAKLCREDLMKAMTTVANLCPAPLTVKQFAALTDFAFNVGGGNLQASTLRKKVVRGDHEGAVQEFHRWVYAGGVKMRGLVRRRAMEATLYAGGTID